MASGSKDDLDDGAESDASRSSDASDASDDSNAVETLVAGRERRSNAGNRMHTLVQEEEHKQDEQDEVTLLFAEVEEEEDGEYTSEEAVEAGDELSSSDDDVENQNTAGDDLEGERALERQEKVEKAKKRKAELALTSGASLRKRVKIDPNLAQKLDQPKKPSKKKERLPWRPNGNVRQSSRAHTQIQTNTTHLKLLEDEKRSAVYKEQREKKERQKKCEQPEKEVTQEDRLKEAGRIERRNLKSLNRWEESEKKRAEEQAAKLAALKDRSLNGPVISWWSGKAVWTGPRLSLVGNKEVTHFQARRTSTGNNELKKRGRKAKALLDQQAALIEAEGGTSSLGTPRDDSVTPAPSEHAATPSIDVMDMHHQESMNAPAATPRQQCAVPIMQLPENSFLQGIQEYATLHGQVPPLGAQALPHLATAPPLVQEEPVLNVPPEPVTVENSTRNLVILDNFDDLSSEGKKHFQVFYNKKTAKLGKPDREMCPITSSQARYRDPSTGIPYANSLAFKKLLELKKHHYTWSSMLDCFVGKVGVVARGVPESFLGDGVSMQDIQGQPYVRPAPLSVPPTPSHQPQPSALA